MHQTIGSTPRDVHWNVLEVSNLFIDWLLGTYRSDATLPDAFGLLVDVLLTLLAARKRADDFAVLATVWSCRAPSEAVSAKLSAFVASAACCFRVPNWASYLGAAAILLPHAHVRARAKGGEAPRQQFATSRGWRPS